MSDEPKVESEVQQNDRRDFLKKAGRFALVAPPTMTMLLSSSVAKAGGGHGGHSDNDIAKSCDDGENKTFSGHHVCKPDYDTRDYDDWYDWIKKWLGSFGWKP